MRVAQIHGPNDVRVDHIAEPVTGPNDVLIKVAACGVCGTDLTFIKLGGNGQPDRPPPMPLGHEAAGIVLETGSAVKNIHPGMRVIVNPMGTRHVIGNGGPEGAFADRLLVRDAVLERGLYEMPLQMSFSAAALTEPLSVARHGVNRACPTPRSKCVVFGTGPIGLGAVFWLKRRGVEHLVAVDLSPERLRMAKILGANETILAGQDNLFEALTALHGPARSVMGRAVDTDIFLDFAGSPQVVTDAIDFAKQGAELVMVGIHPIPEPVDFTKVVVKELTIQGSCGYPTEYPDVIQDLAALGPEAEQFISHRYTFDQFAEAIETAKSAVSAKVMIEFP